MRTEPVKTQMITVSVLKHETWLRLTSLVLCCVQRELRVKLDCSGTATQLSFWAEPLKCKLLFLQHQWSLLLATHKAPCRSFLLKKSWYKLRTYMLWLDGCKCDGFQTMTGLQKRVHHRASWLLYILSHIFNTGLYSIYLPYLMTIEEL